MARLKKPTKRKYPKQPRSNADLQTWKKYHEKVDKINSDYETALTNYNRDAKSRESFKEKVKKLKAKK